MDLPDGVRALDAPRARVDQYDLVLTDCTMPEMNGMDLAAAMLAIRPDMPVLIGTGYAEKVTDEVATARGLEGLLTKPYTMDQLALVLRSAMQRAD